MVQDHFVLPLVNAASLLQAFLLLTSSSVTVKFETVVTLKVDLRSSVGATTGAMIGVLNKNRGVRSGTINKMFQMKKKAIFETLEQ